MKKRKEKLISILITTLSIITIGINSYAHSGRTDSSGGHKDNQNKSGLGSYHYHCGGNPPHLHTNGVCPYSKNTSNQSSTSKSSSSNTKNNNKTEENNTKPSTEKTPVKPTTIDVAEININEKIENFEIGNTKKLTVTIIPENATDKKIKWKSSDDTIVDVDATGEIVAKKAGNVEITATSSNGKESTITINVKEEKKEENTVVTTVAPINNNGINTNNSTNAENVSNPLGGILALGVLGGGGYLGYKKHKNRK